MMGQMTVNHVWVPKYNKKNPPKFKILILNLRKPNFPSKENVILGKKKNTKEGKIPARRLQLGLSLPAIHTAPVHLLLRRAEIPALISIELERAHFANI